MANLIRIHSPRPGVFIKFMDDGSKTFCNQKGEDVLKIVPSQEETEPKPETTKAAQIEAYHPCPFCKEGIEIAPGARGTDFLCRYCRGTGVVAEKCVCGRPAVMTRGGYIGHNRYYCGASECRQVIETEIGAKDPDERPVKRDPFFWSDDRGCWDERFLPGIYCG